MTGRRPKRPFRLPMALTAVLLILAPSAGFPQNKGKVAQLCESFLKIAGLKSNHLPPLLDLSEEEQQAVNSYMQNGAWEINAALRAEIPIDDPTKCPGCALLRQSLQKFQQHSGWVFRRVEMPSYKDVEPYLMKGNVVSDLGFMSTSQSYVNPAFMAQASGPLGLVMLIKSRSGRIINSFENEVLFEPGTKMKVKFVMPRLNRSHLVILEEIAE